MGDYKINWDVELLKRRLDVFVVQSIIRQAALVLLVSAMAFLLGAAAMYLIWINVLAVTASGWCVLGVWTIYTLGVVTAVIGQGFVKGFLAFINSRHGGSD